MKCFWSIKVFSTGFAKDGLILILIFYFHINFFQDLFFHWSKLLTLCLVLLARFSIQLSKSVVISAKVLLKLVDLGSL